MMTCGYTHVWLQGSTCYLASSLQTLAVLVPLRNLVLSRVWDSLTPATGNMSPSPSTSMSPSPSRVSPSRNGKGISRAFRQFLLKWLANSNVYDVEDFFHCLPKSRFTDYFQEEDAQEVLSYLLDTFHEQFDKDATNTLEHPERNPIESIYQGREHTTLKCLDCDFQTTSRQQFGTLPLSLPPAKTHALPVLFETKRRKIVLTHLCCPFGPMPLGKVRTLIAHHFSIAYRHTLLAAMANNDLQVLHSPYKVCAALQQADPETPLELLAEQIEAEGEAISLNQINALVVKEAVLPWIYHEVVKNEQLIPLTYCHNSWVPSRSKHGEADSHVTYRKIPTLARVVKVDRPDMFVSLDSVPRYATTAQLDAFARHVSSTASSEVIDDVVREGRRTAALILTPQNSPEKLLKDAFALLPDTILKSVEGQAFICRILRLLDLLNHSNETENGDTQSPSRSCAMDTETDTGHDLHTCASVSDRQCSWSIAWNNVLLYQTPDHPVAASSASPDRTPASADAASASAKSSVYTSPSTSIKAPSPVVGGKAPHTVDWRSDVPDIDLLIRAQNGEADAQQRLDQLEQGLIAPSKG